MSGKPKHPIGSRGKPVTKVEWWQEPVVQHACINAITASARLYSFARGPYPLFWHPTGRRQDILAQDDLILLAIHSRRLIELTIGSARANKVVFRCRVGRELRNHSYWRVINVLVHSRSLRVLRGRPRDPEGDRTEENIIAIDPICLTESDDGNEHRFLIEGIVEAFDSEILPLVRELSDELLVDLEIEP